LPAAISLNSVTITASLAVGPALGGVLVAWVGPGPVFLLNAVSFVAVLIAISAWRQPGQVSTLPPEHVLSATRTGLRYVINAPEFVAVLVRTLAYITAFSATPALLAVVTRELGGSAADYGLLLGCAGLGGVISAFVLPRIRQLISADAITLAATGGYACTLLAVGTAPSIALIMPFMLIGGFVQQTMFSSLTIAAQQVLPAWVRGRGLAVFMLTYQLGIAGGAAIWGAVASIVGLSSTFVAAAILMAATAALAPVFRLNTADHIDARPVAYHPEQYGPVQVQPDDGPVLITTEYAVPEQRLSAFVGAAHRLKQTRRREGALSWALFEDVERRGTHVENYLMTSWSEHRRQAERRTSDDQQVIDEITSCHDGDGTPPRTRYLLGHHFRRHQQL